MEPSHAPKTVTTAAAPNAIGPYSQATIARGFVFTAGQIAIDPTTGQVIEGDITKQTEQVLANLGAVLAAAGSSWKNVVKTTVYLRHMTDFPAMNDVYGRVIGEARPARSTVEVSGLPRGVLVEIDAVAAVASSR